MKDEPFRGRHQFYDVMWSVRVFDWDLIEVAGQYREPYPRIHCVGWMITALLISTTTKKHKINEYYIYLGAARHGIPNHWPHPPDSHH